MNIEETMSVRQAAEFKGVTRQAIRDAVRAGKIRIVREWDGRNMLNRQDVEAYKPRAKKGKPE